MQRLEEKRNIRRAFILISGTIILVVLIFKWGVPILARISGVIGDLTSSGKPVDKRDFIPPGPPILMIQYEATSSAKIKIRGQSEPEVTVFLTQNKNDPVNVLAGNDGGSEFSDIKLNEGNNSFVAIAIDEAGNKSLASEKMQVVFDDKPPLLEVESPSDRQVISDKPGRIEIKGRTDAGTRLSINDRILIVNQEGAFTGFYSLAAGENLLIINAVDNAGNQTKKEMVVEYQPN